LLKKRFKQLQIGIKPPTKKIVENTTKREKTEGRKKVEK